MYLVARPNIVSWVLAVLLLLWRSYKRARRRGCGHSYIPNCSFFVCRVFLLGFFFLLVPEYPSFLFRHASFCSSWTTVHLFSCLGFVGASSVPTQTLMTQKTNAII